MEHSRNNFPYQLLQREHEIRVLQLLPGQFDDDLRCVLKHVLFDENPKYRALSYVWGDPKVTLPITLDYEHPLLPSSPVSQPFQVTTNLEMALRYIRDPCCETTMWIDAICINQGDTRERSSQVQMMASIYRLATDVVVWLGSLVQEEEAADGVLAEHMQAAWSTLRMISQAKGKLVESKDKEKEAQRLIDGSFLSKVELLKALSRICQRKWFSRVWVLQEYLVAEAPVTAMAGRETMEIREYFQVAFDIVYIVDAYSKHHDGLSFWVVGIHYAISTYITLDHFREDSLSWRLLEVLSWTAGCIRSTDPRDCVYGLLGVLSLMGGIPPEVDVLIPNYDKPLPDFFTDVARFIIEGTLTLSVLQFAGDEQLREGQPSWAPSWNFPSTLLSMQQRASIQEFTQVRFSPCRTILHVGAVRLGGVALCHSIPIRAMPNVADLARMMGDLERNMRALPAVRDMFPDDQDLGVAILNAIYPQEQGIEASRERYDILMGRSTWPGSLAHPGASEEDDLNILRRDIEMCNMLGIRVLALENGMIFSIWYGIGIDDAAIVGDIAYLFPGCRRPHLTTEVGDGTLVIHYSCWSPSQKTEEEHLDMLERGEWEDVSIR